MAIFKNSQWVVTCDGIESPAEGGYWIEMYRVGQETSRGAVTYYDWPVHLAEKDWVNRPLFFEAFVHALRRYARQTGEPINEAMLGRTYIMAMETEKDTCSGSTFLETWRGHDAAHRADNSDTHLTHGCMTVFRYFSRVRCTLSCILPMRDWRLSQVFRGCGSHSHSSTSPRAASRQCDTPFRVA